MNEKIEKPLYAKKTQKKSIEKTTKNKTNKHQKTIHKYKTFDFEI